MRQDKRWYGVLTILIKYKFAEVGTAESTADEIYDLFLKDVFNPDKIEEEYREAKLKGEGK